MLLIQSRLNLLYMQKGNGVKRKIAIVAPTSTVARNYISYLGDKYDVLTVGRRNSDIIFDLVRDDVLDFPEGLDTVINFAGVLHADSAGEICNMVAVNVSAMLKICEAASCSGVEHLILISSINATLPENSRYYGYYSLTKKQGEELVDIYCKKMGLKLCIIRPSQIFGTDQRYGKVQPLLYMMIKNALENKPITIYGNYDARRNYIFSDNLFQVINESVERKFIGIIDAVSPDNFTLSETAGIISTVVGSSSKVIFLKDKQDMEDNAFYAHKDVFKEWNLPYIPFEEAINRTVEAMKSGTTNRG